MPSVADFMHSWRYAPLAAAISLGLTGFTTFGFAQAPATTPDPATERVEAFRADFLRAPDFGLWFQRRVDRGLIVADVATSGAISKVCFEEGDRILAVNDQKVATEVEFVRSIFVEPVRLRPVKIRVVRDNRELVLVVFPFRLIEELIAASGEPLEPLGIVLQQDLPHQVVVAKVLPRSPAYYAGLRAGDEVLKFERTALTEQDHLARLILTVKPGAIVTLAVQRGERERFLELEIPGLANERIVQPGQGKNSEITRKHGKDPGGLSPGGEVPAGTKRKRVDPGGVSPGGDVPRDPKPVPPT